MAANGMSPATDRSVRDIQYQSTGQLSREEGTAGNSLDDGNNQFEALHPAPQPIHNSKLNDSTNPGSSATDNNINPNGNRHNITNSLNQTPTQTPTDEEDAAQQPWFRRIAEKYGTLELENKGSVARDHLALERTFLAWLRTSLSFASIGIAVTQLFRLNSSVSCSPSQTTSAVSYINNNDNNNLFQENSQRSSPSLLEVLIPPSSYQPPLDTTSLTATSGDSSQYHNIGKPLGATFIGIAILILVIGFHRYFESQYWIVRGKFPASRGSVALVSFVAAGLVISSFVVILVIAPNAREL